MCDEKIKDGYAFRHLLINGVHFVDYAHAGKVWDGKLITVRNDIKEQ